MNIPSGRIFFERPPAEDQFYFSGKIYAPAGELSAASSDTRLFSDYPRLSGDNRPSDRRLIEELKKIAARPELLNELEADLALVNFDRAKNRWRLLRDFGTTPLYYAELPGGLAWSFSYAGLLDLLKAPEPDEAVMFDYLATHYRYIFRDAGRTFHRGVRQVPAGGYVDFSPAGAEVKSWLKLEADPELYALSPQEATERLMELLRHSVRLRAGAAEKPAFTVSSGLDSSTVASLASEQLGDLDVFSVGYSGLNSEEYDETAGIKELLAGRDWRWTHLLLDTPDLVAETKGLIELTRSPVVTVTWLAYYLMARQFGGFKEMFNGLGGDESLAGEFVHFFYFFADLKKEGLEDRLKLEVEAWSRLHDHPVHRKNPETLKAFWARNIDFPSGLMRVDREVYRLNWRFFEDNWIEAHGLADPPMPRPYPNFLSNRLYQEIIHETTTPTLWGLFMANQALGLRGVSPFMSVRLFRFCLALSGEVKYDRGLTKALLRRGLKGVLPESLRLSPKKTGFNAPIHQWFREAAVAGPLLEMLKDGPLAGRGWLKKGAAETILEEHETGRANHMMLLWTLLNASLFLKR